MRPLSAFNRGCSFLFGTLLVKAYLLALRQHLLPMTTPRWPQAFRSDSFGSMRSICSFRIANNKPKKDDGWAVFGQVSAPLIAFRWLYMGSLDGESQFLGG